MNRLPSSLPGRWLDELLPGQPNTRPGAPAAWRFATAAAARPAPAAPVPPGPVRMHGKQSLHTQAEPSRTARSAPNPVREQPAEDREAWPASQDGGKGGQGGGSGGDGAGQGEGEADVSGAAQASTGELDAQDIVALLPAGDSSGIFEVHLPGGEAMAVAVDAGPAAVTYHLKPASKGLAERLRGRQKELSAHLERRIGKDVTLTIL